MGGKGAQFEALKPETALERVQDRVADLLLAAGCNGCEGAASREAFADLMAAVSQYGHTCQRHERTALFEAMSADELRQMSRVGAS